MPSAEVHTELWVSEYISPYDIYQHGVKRVLAAKRTRYQDMLIVDSGLFGKGLVLDGKWQSCTGDEFIYHEALVQPAMIQHGAVRRALVLGGGEGATLREILRWEDVERVVMVDIDEEVVAACREHLPEMHQGAFEDPRVELVIGDALEYLEKTDERFDIVISDLSDPIAEGPSFRLFTKETFELGRRVLEDDGIFVLQAGPVAPPQVELHARLVVTLGAVWPETRSYSAHIASYAAPWGFAMASTRPFDGRPDPMRIDSMLADLTSGGFRFLDGQTFLGLMQAPAYVRRAIDAEERILTMEDPPKFFGTGGGASKQG